jgi:nicotinamide phosphoribosyltransferase
MGGALLQIVNRDDLKFAMKACAICIRNVWTGISKNPVTDPGKRSKQGRLALVKADDNWFASVTPEQAMRGERNYDLLRTVYENGKLSNMESLATIRERLASQ